MVDIDSKIINLRKIEREREVIEVWIEKGCYVSKKEMLGDWLKRGWNIKKREETNASNGKKVT